MLSILKHYLPLNLKYHLMIHLLELEQNSTVATDAAPPAALVECLPCSCKRAQGRLPEVTQSHSISHSSTLASQWFFERFYNNTVWDLSYSSWTHWCISTLACMHWDLFLFLPCTFHRVWFGWHPLLPTAALNIASSLLLRDIKMFFVPRSSCCQVQDLHFRQWHQLSYLIMCCIIKGQPPTSSGEGALDQRSCTWSELNYNPLAWGKRFPAKWKAVKKKKKVYMVLKTRRNSGIFSPFVCWVNTLRMC